MTKKKKGWGMKRNQIVPALYEMVEYCDLYLDEPKAYPHPHPIGKVGEPASYWRGRKDALEDSLRMLQHWGPTNEQP